eukprot:1842190-Alexandrium_andersonii.AAC.1
MSASLVGSEMCIRDSNPPTHTVVVCRAGLWPSQLRGPSSGLLDGARAVSYTHLTLPTICSV